MALPPFLSGVRRRPHPDSGPGRAPSFLEGYVRDFAARGGATKPSFLLDPHRVATSLPPGAHVRDLPSPAQAAEREARLGLERGRHAASDDLRTRTLQRALAHRARLQAEQRRIHANPDQIGRSISLGHAMNVHQGLRDVEDVIHRARALPPLPAPGLTPQERASAVAGAPEPSWLDRLSAAMCGGSHDATAAAFGQALAAMAGGGATFSPTRVGVDPTTDRYQRSVKNVGHDARAIVQSTLDAPRAGMRAAASGVSRGLGNGPVDPSVYRDDVPSRVAGHVGEYAPYAVPVAGQVLGGLQGASVALGVANDSLRKTASDLYHGMAPWEARTPEEAALRFVGLLGGAAHVAGMSPQLRGRVGIAAEAFRRGRPVDPEAVIAILRDAHQEAAARGRGQTTAPPGRSGRFAAQAVADSTLQAEHVHGRVAAAAARRFAELKVPGLEGADIAFTADRVRHGVNQHGRAGIDPAPLRVGDYDRIGDLVNDPRTRVTIAPKSGRRANPILTFEDYDAKGSKLFAHFEVRPTLSGPKLELLSTGMEGGVRYEAPKPGGPRAWPGAKATAAQRTGALPSDQPYRIPSTRLSEEADPIVISSKRFSAPGVSPRKASELYARNTAGHLGAHVNDETGWALNVNKDSFRGPTFNGATAEAVGEIPQIIRKAVRIESFDPDRSNQNAPRVHRFATPLVIQGDPYVVNFLVKDRKLDGYKLVHEVQAIHVTRVGGPSLAPQGAVRQGPRARGSILRDFLHDHLFEDHSPVIGH